MHPFTIGGNQQVLAVSWEHSLDFTTKRNTHARVQSRLIDGPVTTENDVTFAKQVEGDGGLERLNLAYAGYVHGDIPMNYGVTISRWGSGISGDDGWRSQINPLTMPIFVSNS